MDIKKFREKYGTMTASLVIDNAIENLEIADNTNNFRGYDLFNTIAALKELSKDLKEALESV